MYFHVNWYIEDFILQNLHYSRLLLCDTKFLASLLTHINSTPRSASEAALFLHCTHCHGHCGIGMYCTVPRLKGLMDFESYYCAYACKNDYQ